MTDICGGPLDRGIRGPINRQGPDAARADERGGLWA